MFANQGLLVDRVDAMPLGGHGPGASGPARRLCPGSGVREGVFASAQARAHWAGIDWPGLRKRQETSSRCRLLLSGRRVGPRFSGLRPRTINSRRPIPAGAIARLAAGGTADAFARFFPGSAREGPSIQHHQPGPGPGAQRRQRRGGIRAARVSSRLGLAAVLLMVGVAVSLLYNWLILWKFHGLLKRGVTVRREWPATRKVGVRWVSSAIVVPNAAVA